MKRLVVSLFPLAFALSCFAQTPYIGPGLASLMKQLTDASQSKNAQQYASAFSDNAHWQGPQGQDAVGTANVQRAVALFFDNVGPLQTRAWRLAPLGTDYVFVEMFQGNPATVSRKSAPVAPGSASRRAGDSFRTWLILGRHEEQWWVTAASIADIRTREITP
jgi:hypothetical protein